MEATHQEDSSGSQVIIPMSQEPNNSSVTSPPAKFPTSEQITDFASSGFEKFLKFRLLR